MASSYAFIRPDSDKYFEIIKNLEIFTNLYKELNAGYVDELDPARTMRTGIDAMLQALDPYTNYISESDIEGYRTLTEGRYNGIGAQVKKIGDLVTITQIYENSPALKAGLKTGDRILEVDGQDARNRSTEDLNNIMQGFPGTQVKMRINRPGENKPFTLTLTREEVDLPNVPYFGMVDDHIGYIVLTTFTQQAGNNIAKAYKDLRVQDPLIQGLILDLRDNGGGLLNEAVNICNIFVDRGELVVSTKGKIPEWDRSYKTTQHPLNTEIPLVILVNNHSASASEIVCGTIQDLDRGVVMGQLTYGKGLVQNTKEIGYNARLKLTTAKYYIPSGRCIQAINYKDGEPVHIPDDQRAKFKTRSGRPVLDGGGVKPDVVLEKPKDPALIHALLEQDMIFDYTTEFCLKHDSIAGPETFRFDDWAGFTAFLQDRKFTYETASDKAIGALKEKAKEEGLDASLKAQITAIENNLGQYRDQSLGQHKEAILSLIEQEIIGRYYFNRGRKQLGLRNDPEIVAANQLLKDPERYRKILKGK
ncbi:MAG: S41 family peptidase [Saprospiraceae bacterium]|nr:S41 family peptidase [Saprospiraceae bacterium]